MKITGNSHTVFNTFVYSALIKHTVFLRTSNRQHIEYSETNSINKSIKCDHLSEKWLLGKVDTSHVPICGCYSDYVQLMVGQSSLQLMQSLACLAELILRLFYCNQNYNVTCNTKGRILTSPSHKDRHVYSFLIRY